MPSRIFARLIVAPILVIVLLLAAVPVEAAFAGKPAGAGTGKKLH